ncbi:molybdenum cofactor biosynthesis protein MoaE [Govanella unica]|uniref:Molybdopterin synthase catalytic subunit n=1 Tax=Govanella unica TaxID=2975056 RepID=A0A9X3U1C8_9PROT|nr:molybdenum cofactor biosynthesis protein MoaE [Govania unica]MDA5194784.1 molybdenum cofactor biosynthesis protein MoaE [Govania unica]
MLTQIGPEVIDPGAELSRFEAGLGPNTGAVTSFTGRARADDGLTGLTLEHYPAMAARELGRITDDAMTRFGLADVMIRHRVGPMVPGDVIVFVATASAHRAAAFEAASFLMDYLKTRAPIWKQETAASGTRWVEAKAQDDAAAARWSEPK